MPLVRIDEKTKELLVRLMVLGDYSNTQQALEDSINDYFNYVVKNITSEIQEQGR